MQRIYSGHIYQHHDVYKLPVGLSARTVVVLDLKSFLYIDGKWDLVEPGHAAGETEQRSSK